jgi:small-conductance mechanosensitive channel
MAERYLNWAHFIGTRGVRILAIIAVAFIIVRLLRMLTRRLVRAAKPGSYTAALHEKQARTIAGLLFSAGSAIVLSLAALEVFREFGFDVTPVAAVAGLASVALGFGAQNLVRDIINGFIIFFEEQYAVGDLIEIGETRGRVEFLTLRRTVIRTDTGSLVTVPNGSIVQVGNLSRDWRQVFVDVSISPDESASPAIEALEHVAASFRADPAWRTAILEGPRVLGVEALGSAGTTLRLAVRCHPGRELDVARELRRRVREALAERSIPSSVSQRLHLMPAKQDS